MGLSNLMWDIRLMWNITVSFETKQSHVGLISLMGDRVVSYRTEQSHVGQNNPMWEEKDLVRQSSIIWDRSV